MRIPYWIESGSHFVWYRKVRECRNYHDARFVHYLTVFNWTFSWETK